MELTELQKLWGQYDERISENTRLNKEILKTMLLSKPEKKINWIKIEAGFNLILPIVLILGILLPRVEYRTESDFYIGFLLFGIVSVVSYYWAIRYYLLINKIDFKNSITSIKKDIKELEKYKIKITKLGFIFIPFALIGILLIAEIPILSTDSILPISLIILVMIISIYFTFKHSIFERFQKLNMEIDEVEQLEKK